MKIKLQKRKEDGYRPPGHCIKSINRSLPFYLSKKGKYFHRIRTASNHWRDGNLSHTAIHFWCGGSGFLNGNGRLYAEISSNGVLCATCEGKAVGAGVEGARIINGRKVMFSPRNG